METNHSPPGYLITIKEQQDITEIEQNTAALKGKSLSSVSFLIWNFSPQINWMLTINKASMRAAVWEKVFARM